MFVRMVLAASVALIAYGPASARAQSLSDRAIDRAVRATVRVQVDLPAGPGDRGGSSTGSGALIDARGYVLTNLHVVGNVRPGRGGLPGTFFGDGEHVQIATVESARTTAQPRWLARVVRADVALDLALLRITASVDGTPLPRGTSFPTIEIASTEGLSPGSPLWAFGFPLTLRTINVTGGHATGFQMNARGEVAWIRTDADFNPGNSGGVLVDARGRLVGIPTAVVRGEQMLASIELARPAERIPRAWLDALARGPIDDVVVSRIETLASGVEMTISAIGDAGGLDDDAEIQLFRIPAERGALVRSDPPVPLAIVTERGVVSEGRGSVSFGPAVPQTALLAVLLPPSRDGSWTSTRIVFSPAMALGSRAEAATVGGAVPAGVGGLGIRGSGGGGGGRDAIRVVSPGRPGSDTIVRAPGAGGAPASRGPRSDVFAVGGGVVARGSVLEAGSSRPVSAWVIVARPGVDPQQVASLVMSGRITPTELDQMVLTRTRADVGGGFELRGLVPGVLPTLVVADGYRPTVVQLTIPAGAPVVTLSPLQLAR